MEREHKKSQELAYNSRIIHGSSEGSNGKKLGAAGIAAGIGAAIGGPAGALFLGGIASLIFF